MNTLSSPRSKEVAFVGAAHFQIASLRRDWQTSNLEPLSVFGTRLLALLLLVFLAVLAGCKPSDSSAEKTTKLVAIESPCSGVWPSYWQDPAFDKQNMWKDQEVSNTPASNNWVPSNAAYTNPAFQLADAYSKGRPDDPAAQPWRDTKFDALFKLTTPQAEKLKLAQGYGWELMRYIQAGNIDTGNVNTDWNACANKVRQWFNMPFQTYDVLKGREFIHGLTREAPVQLSLKSKEKLGTTIWAIAFYNGNAAPTMSKVWRPDGTASVPTDNLAFAEGTVIGKLLFTTADASDMPFLQGLPRWTANISMGDPGAENPTNCAAKNMSMPDQSRKCRRTPRTVTLFQFDVAVRDARAPSGWVFGTFVADGEARATEKNPWNRISLLGLMWGDDTPPMGQLASEFPVNPREKGFSEGVIDWSVVDRLNSFGGGDPTASPGHLGCNSRLNGPADNKASSCTSCHATASVPDSDNSVPPILTQFASPKITPQCHIAGDDGKELNNVTFAQMDSVYFAKTRCSSPFNTVLNGVCIVGTLPNYAGGRPEWISTDFSLQMSQSLQQWHEWQAHKIDEPILSSGMKNLNMKRVKKTSERVFTTHLQDRND